MKSFNHINILIISYIMSAPAYNTRSNKKSITPAITLVEKPGIRGPPDSQQDDVENEESMSPITTIYVDDILKKMLSGDKEKAFLEQVFPPSTYQSNPFINLLTSMANKELQSTQRLRDIKNKRKEKENKKKLKYENKDDLEDELNELNEEQQEHDSKDSKEYIEDQEVSIESLLKQRTKSPTHSLFKDGKFLDLDNTDSEEEYDELDEQYCEMWENENMDPEDSEWAYFHDLKKDDKSMFLSKLKEIKGNINEMPMRFKIASSDLPLDIKSICMKKIMSISQMDESSGEYYKSQQWLDTLMQVPFGKYEPFPVTPDSSVEEKAEFIHKLSKKMTEAIYGHKEAKTQILQIVAQSVRNPDATGNVIAIQGPMGNGKTTLVKEGIAKALGRPFAFIALGGATDASYFDGHNFTYEGSKWGRIVDILIQCKCMNPIFYFDELDKISDTSKGQEIVHLLTHLTDSSQNNTFNDNYFSGVDFDMSKALFIFSFNDESMVDPILKDRMNVINTDGFNAKDKQKIANDYLLPDIYKEFNIEPEDILFPEETIKNIIENYTNSEKGVRNLKRCLTNIISKLNVWTMMNLEDQEELPYKLKEVNYPYTVSLDTCSVLLNKKNTDAPPVGMYL